ncbi:MAG: hypothetical protein U0174_02090 [Polyangiaceae bacterium]
MQSVRGFLLAPPIELNVALAFGGGFALYGVTRNASTYDTRFLPANKGEADKARYLYLLVEGAFEWIDGERYEGPTAFVASAEIFDGAHGKRLFPFRAGGEKFRAVQLRIAGDELGDVGWDAPSKLDFSKEARAAAAEYLDAADLETRCASAEALLRALHTSGILRQELRSRSEVVDVMYRELWRKLFPVFERFAFGTTRAELGEAASAASRDRRYDMSKLASAFNFSFGGWREFALRCRMRIAVLLLSHPDIAIRDVAKSAGYSTTEAFTHALYAEGLPAPGVIRQRILEYRRSETAA